MQLSRREALSLLGALTCGGDVNGQGFFDPKPQVTRGDTAKRRRLLYELLGDLPDRSRPIACRTVWEGEREEYHLEKLELDLNGIEAVPAFFVRPKARAEGSMPAVLFNHSHGGGYAIGKDEFVVGRGYLQPPPYAAAIAGCGWAGLCIDHWVFGERSHTPELDMFKAMLWQGRIMWGMMVYDSLRAVDYLCSRPEVDPQKIATLGISMGSTMAWWLAALDERIKVTVDICCLTDFHTLLRKKGLAHHGIYYYVPGLLKRFTTAGINSLIAPRAHLSIAGTRDALTPVEGLDLIDAELKVAYRACGLPENWRLIRYDVGHEEMAEGRREILAFLKRHL